MADDTHDTKTTILERLGNVLYWAGCILGLLGFVHGNVTAEFSGHDSTTQWLAGLYYGLPIWLIGLAARYVLTGRMR